MLQLVLGRDLSHWTDPGVIVSQDKVPWVKPDSYSMWAPDCLYRNGKYYFYFPSAPANSEGRAVSIREGLTLKENALLMQDQENRRFLSLSVWTPNINIFRAPPLGPW